MLTLTTLPKIRKILEEIVLDKVESWMERLLSGDISSYEQELSKSLEKVYNMIFEQLLPLSSSQVYDDLVRKGKAMGGKIKVNYRDCPRSFIFYVLPFFLKDGRSL